MDFGSTIAIAFLRRRQPDQIIMNAEAIALELSADVLQKLNEATEILKIQMGPNADPWRTASRIQ